MKLKSLALAALVALGVQAHAAVVTVSQNAGPYTLTYSYDNALPLGFIDLGFFSSGGGAVGFEWSIADIVNVTSVAGLPVTATFAVPDFTIAVNPGYTLTGAITSSIGNIIYAVSGVGATTSMSATGSFAVDGGPMISLPLGPLAKVVSSPSIGYFADSATAPIAAFSTFSVSGASITLNASGGSFAAIGAQTQNKLKFEFTANPVPEPETYALMLAGLGVVGLMARRRQRA